MPIHIQWTISLQRLDHRLEFSWSESIAFNFSFFSLSSVTLRSLCRAQQKKWTIFGEFFAEIILFLTTLRFGSSNTYTMSYFVISIDSKIFVSWVDKIQHLSPFQTLFAQVWFFFYWAQQRMSHVWKNYSSMSFCSWDFWRRRESKGDVFI